MDERPDNVVEFPSQQKLNEDHTGSISKALEETVKKGFMARDQVLRTLCNDIMSVNVNIAAAMRVLTEQLGVSKTDIALAVKKEIENVGKAITILDGDKTLRERLEAAREADLLESPHFDAITMIDQSGISEEEKISLAREFKLI